MEDKEINATAATEATTCFEDESARTEYSKRFDNPQTGLHTAVLFSSPVHFDDGDGMAEIDNEFIDAVNADGEAVFENKRNKFRVRLAKSTAQKKLVEIEDGKYRISMTPTSSKVLGNNGRSARRRIGKVEAVCNRHRNAVGDKAVEFTRGAARMHISKHAPSDLCYCNALENCDLEYTVASDRLKENIIVNSKSDFYEFAFKLKLENLEPRVTESGAIELFDAETNEVKFTIPTPFMFDADGNKSDAVAYKLSGKPTEPTLTVTADPEWINADGRAFPVTIDPQIMGNTTSIITMQNSDNGKISPPDGDQLAVGNNFYNGQNHTYGLEVRINANAVREALGSQTRVLHAILELTRSAGEQPSNSKGFTVKTSTGLIDKFTFSGPNNRLDIDITALIRKVLRNSGESDILLKIDRIANDSATDYIVFMTGKSNVSEYRPRIFVDYVSSRLNSDGMEYATADAARAGTGSVNLDTLETKWEHSDLKVKSGALTVPVSHVYNGSRSNATHDAVIGGGNRSVNTDNFRCGRGFKLNIQQRLVRKPSPESAKLMGSACRVYIDGLGNHHDFTEKYFFVKDGYAHYVDRADCRLKADGGLTYNDNGVDRDITYETTNELGMKLICYSRYADYVASDKKFTSRYYYVMNGKRVYIERDGDKATLTVYFYTLANGKKFFVAPAEVYSSGGKYYAITGELLTQETEEQTIVDNKISVKTSAFNGSTAYDYVTSYDLIEERIYEDNAAFSMNDYVDTDDIKNVRARIAELQEYKKQAEDNIRQYREQSSELTMRFNKQNELNNQQRAILDKQYDIQLKQYQYQVRQTRLQFNRMMFTNAVYYYTPGIYTFYFNENAPQEFKFATTTSGNSNLSAQMNAAENSQAMEYAIYHNCTVSENKITEYSAKEYTKLIDNQNMLLQAQLVALNKPTSLYNKNVAYLNATVAEQQRQYNQSVAEINDAIAKYEAQVADINSQISTLKLQLKELANEQKKQPTDVIITSDNTALWFDYFGKLVSITDAYENRINIIYDGDKLTRVTDGDDNVLMEFEHKNNKLSSMTDAQGRTLKFEYSGVYLCAIVYADGTRSTFEYDSLCRLAKVSGAHGKSVEITYGESAVTLAQKTTAAHIDKHGVEHGEAQTLYSAEITKPSELTASVKTATGETLFGFDSMGRKTTEHTVTTDGEHSAAVEYNGLSRTFTCNDVLGAENHMANGDFASGLTGWSKASECQASVIETERGHAVQLSGEKACYIMREITMTDELRGKLSDNGLLVLSAWAKASSMPILHNKRKSAYGSDIFSNYEADATNSSDTLRTARRFGLYVGVEYADGTSDYSECAFDFNNTDWQFAALPIKIADKNTASKITVMADYGYNNGSAQFTDIRLNECEEYTARKFDMNGNMTSEFDGKHKTTYEYEDGLPVKATLDDGAAESVMRYTRQGKLAFVRGFDGVCEARFYNKQGEVVRIERYSETDPTSKYVKEYTYSDDGTKTSETETEYKYANGLTTSVTAPNGTETVYAYDYDDETVTGMSGTADGEGNSATYKYTDELLTSVTHNDFDVDYSYDGKGRLLGVEIAGNSAVEYAHTDDTTTAAYADGTAIKTTSDGKGNTLKVEDITDETAVTLMEYSYDEKGRCTAVADGVSGATETFEYDSTDRLVSKTTDAHGTETTVTNTYDRGLLKQSQIKIGETTELYKYAYSDDYTHDLTGMELPNGIVQTLGKDGLGRMHTLSQKCGDTAITDESIYYVKHGDSATDNVSSIRFGINGNHDEQTKYKYDKAGNITEVYENGILASRYAYDKLNRIVREDNKAFGKTTVFTYDVGGNILSKAEYAFTLGSVEDKTPLSVIPYSYRASGWRDQMTSFNGEKCEYDVMGRPTKYRNKQLVWSKYGTLVNNSGNTYSYDANGIRQSKTVDGDTTEFFTDGSKILRSVDNNHDIWYNYGANGIQGITVNGIKYVFRKNVFGDVTHIYKLNEGALELAAEYKYDAWGKCIVTEADESGIGAINPIRYRGYYFDTESGLYYLNARYYDPETGRFISADETKFLDPNTVNGLNLYAYCVNNPVMNVDPSGNFSWKAFWNKVATVVTAIVAGIVVIGGIIATVASMGAALPAVAAFGLSVLGSAAIGMGGAIISNINSQTNVNGWGNVDIKQVLTAGGIGFIAGAITGGISYGIGKIAQGIGEQFGYLLSNTKIGGLLVSKVFSSSFLTIAFGVMGNAVGGLGASLLGDYLGNSLFNSSYKESDAKNTVASVIFNWFLQFVYWIFNL